LGHVTPGRYGPRDTPVPASSPGDLPMESSGPSPIVLPFPRPDELFRSGIQGKPMLSTGFSSRGAEGSRIVGGIGGSGFWFCGSVGFKNWIDDRGGRFP
jgi:hypothetical protein